MDLFETTVRRRKLFFGNIVNLRIDHVLTPGNNLAPREVVEHPGGVCVVALSDAGTVYLVNQYRHPLEALLLELPAGKLDYGEDPLNCGIRELKEEVGITADEIVPLGFSFLSPGFSNEKIYIYLALGLHMGQQSPDEDEFLEVIEKSLSELLAMIENGGITDAKTMIGLLRAKQYLDNLDNK